MWDSPSEIGHEADLKWIIMQFSCLKSVLIFKIFIIIQTIRFMGFDSFVKHLYFDITQDKFD